MAGVICDNGAQLLGEAGAALIAGDPLRLFSNNHTPALTDAADGSDYTEATFPGYAAAALSSPTSVGVSAHVAIFAYDVVTFSRAAGAGSETIYGYYVTDAGNLVYAELFPFPIVISVAGQLIVVAPVLSYQDESV